MKNFICTAKGFVMGKRFDPDTLETEVLYTEKVRDAQGFKTSGAVKFMASHDIKGFVWKPYEQDAVRNMYEVRKIRKSWCEGEGEKIEEWQPVRAIMRSHSDIAFLTHKEADLEGLMTFEEAKAEALRRNIEMVSELNAKINELTTKTEEL